MIVNFLQAIWVVLLPLLMLVIPGICIVRKNLPSLAVAARVVLWSVSLLTLGSLLVTLFHLPVWLIAAAAALSGCYGLWRHRRALADPRVWWRIISIAAPLIILYGAFSVPLLMYHEGLPTGDAQKAIYWAQQIIDRQRLPDYQTSVANFNRDPVDFYTPGLHAFTALAMQLSPLPLTTVGFLAIAMALGVALVGGALAFEILPTNHRLLASGLTIFLILTNIRFLRYIREPGYHWQNIVGELYMFGLLYLAISLLRRWRWSDVALAAALAAALAVSHQFSTFLTFFMLLPAVVVFIARHRHTRVIIGIVGVLALVGAWSVGLQHKLPDLFTARPHLLADVPSLLDYFTLMGAVWLMLGLAGMLLLFRKIQAVPLLLASTVLLVLTQGPRLGIDIPPVRTLFYLAVPLSITAAYFVMRLHKIFNRPGRILLWLLVCGATYASTSQAFILSHAVRTNSTLTAEQATLIEYIKKNPGAVLTDNYDRQSTSWLLLANQPTFSRLASDISRQMTEAVQSSSRRQLYYTQLDFEKIFSLGSLPEIVPLLSKYNIHYLIGIDGSSDIAFAHNPALTLVRRADDITLYKTPPNLTLLGEESGVGSWLLKPSTLANDIGDDEDTFQHLPASLRATRLSGPLLKAGITYRRTTAPLIPLQFNVGDYVEALWDQDHNHYPDGALDLLVNNTVRRIEAGEAPIDEDGFITLYLPNPEATAFDIDLIALGLARVP